jgi:hypothetical protein
MSETSGRKNNQKMKPYLVYQYLLKQSDENHIVTAADLVAYLEECCGIKSERRSIYRDIDVINKTMYMLENEVDIDEAESAIENDDYGNEKTVIYDKHRKGFYVRQRHYELSDIRLISECIYSSKYISQDDSKRLVEIMKGFVSEYEAENIRTEALVTARVKTLNKATLGNVSTIYDAMSKKIEGEKHIPEKISFQYLKYSVNDVNKQIERRKGAKYVVSPYKLIINDGNYYLLAFDDYNREIRTYRVDRMKDLRRTGEAREGAAEFAAIDLKSYTQRVFSMFNGEKQRLRIKFNNALLDTVIERFGRGENVVYSKAGDFHFVVYVDVEISEQFFGWICGFGSKVQILAPQTVKERFISYIDKIRNVYDE